MCGVDLNSRQQLKEKLSQPLASSVLIPANNFAEVLGYKMPYTHSETICKPHLHIVRLRNEKQLHGNNTMHNVK